MSRPSCIIKALLFVVAALQFAGCKTIYSDTYAWKRNHYKPLAEKVKPADLLPVLPPSTPANDAPPPLPGGGLPPAPAPEMAAPAPAIPGL